MTEHDLSIIKRFVRLCRDTVADYINTTYGAHITKDDIKITCTHTDSQSTSITAKSETFDDMRFELVFCGDSTEFKLLSYKQNDSALYRASSDDLEHLRKIIVQE